MSKENKKISFEDGILLNHNQQAYLDLMEGIAKDNRACAVRATGSGKMFLALKWLKDNPTEPFVYIAPTNVILNRFVETIIDVFLAEQAEKLSKKSVDEKVEFIQKNLGFNLKLYTYSKLNKMSAEDIVEMEANNVVLDEFHRCGATKWGQSVEFFLETHPEAKIMGLSATPIRPSDNKNMVEELFNGKIASELTLSDAMEQGVLPIPTMINAIYSFQDEIISLENKIKDKKLAPKKRKELQEKLKEAKILIGKAGGIKELFRPFVDQVIQNKGKEDVKLVVFCKDIADRDRKMHECKSWFPGKKIKKYSLTSKEAGKSIDGEDSDLKFTEKVIHAFEEDNSKGIKLLFAVDILNEGLHVKGIDGVIMLRNTESNIIFLQQLGRALAVDSNRKSKPIVFDLVNNVEVLEEDLNVVREFLKKKNFDEFKSNEKYDWFEEVLGIRAEITDLLKLAKGMLTHSFEDKIAPLVAYSKENGSIRSIVEGVKYKMNGVLYHVDNIVKDFRKSYRKGKLSDEEISRLESIGMVWLVSGYDFDNVRVDLKVFIKDLLMFIEKYNRYPTRNGNEDGESLLYIRLLKWRDPAIRKLNEQEIEYLKKYNIDIKVEDPIGKAFKAFVKDFLEFYKKEKRNPKFSDDVYTRWQKWTNPENLNEEQKKYLVDHGIEFRVVAKDNLSVSVLKFVKEYREFCEKYGRKPRNNYRKTKGYIDGEDSLYQRWRGWTNPKKEISPEERKYLDENGFTVRKIEENSINGVRKGCIEFVQRMQEFVAKYNRRPRDVRDNTENAVEGESALYSAYIEWTDPTGRRKNPNQAEIEYMKSHNIEIREGRKSVGNIRQELIDAVEKYFEFVKKYGRPPSYKRNADCVEGEIKIYNNLNDWKNPTRKNLNEDEIRYLEEKGFKLSKPKKKVDSSASRNSADEEIVDI